MTTFFVWIQASLFLLSGAAAAALVLNWKSDRRPYWWLGFLSLFLLAMLWGVAVDYSMRPLPSALDAPRSED